jgi:hypothetical protein
MSIIAKTVPVIVAGSGDKAAEAEGEVIAGKSLRERWGVPADTKPPKLEETKTAEELEAERAAAEAAAKPKPAPKAKKIPAKPVIAPRAPTGQFISPKEVAEIAKAVVDAGTKKVETAATTEPALTAKQQKKLDVLKRMETLNPESKGIADKFKAATLALVDYQRKWEDDPANKGKKFNIEDGDHADFLTKHDVPYDPDDYAEALADIRAEQKTKPFEDRFKSQEAEQARAGKVRELMPQIITHQRTSAKVFVDQLPEEFKGLLNEGGIIVPEVRDKLLAEGNTHKAVLSMAQRVETMAAELMGVANRLIDFSARNPLHVEMFQFIQKQEAETKKLPADQQLNGDGKLFATSEEWSKMSEAERENHWHLTDTDLSALYATEMADNAKVLLDDAEAEFTKRAERRGLKAANGAPAPAQKPAPAAPARERSPVGAVAPRVAPTGEAPETQLSALKKRWLG